MHNMSVITLTTKHCALAGEKHCTTHEQTHKQLPSYLHIHILRHKCMSVYVCVLTRLAQIMTTTGTHRDL